MAIEHTQVKELEPVGIEGDILSPEEFSDARINALLAYTKNLPKLRQANDSMLRYSLSIAAPGDWVVFSGKDGRETAELSWAGADRIARELGINWVDWKTPRKEVLADSNGEYFIWWYECTTTFRERRIEMTKGRASSRDKFFGYEHGAWKEMGDVRADNVETAAWRNARKEGVKIALGISRMPVDTLVSLGIKREVLKSVEFQSKSKQLSAEDTKAADDGLIRRKIAVSNVTKGGEGKNAKGQPWIRWDITDAEGVRYGLFAAEDSARLATLRAHHEDQLPVEIAFQNKPYQDKSGKQRDSYQIVKVEGAENE